MSPVHYLDLTDYLAIAAEVTGLDNETLVTVTRLDLADSALHAPDAGWGEEDLYPEFVDKAAVLLVRLTKNHPLPDGNKRAAWVSFRMFVEINGFIWRDFPTVDQSEELMIAIASGQRGEEWVSTWLASRLHDSDARDESASE